MDRDTFEMLRRELRAIAEDIKRHTDEAIGKHTQEVDEKVEWLRLHFDVSAAETSAAVEGAAEDWEARMQMLANDLNARLTGLHAKIDWLTHIAESPLQSGQC